ncbi:MAG: UvrD-helicase domain-containing protein [Clostridia bacterium]|nr:UvrD-helicase domain-containing protein [Clostridia bacterium]
MMIADLHIHSKYSRATSSEGDAPHLHLWAKYKGIDLIGTGDFTHPKWREELKEMLIPDGSGLYRLKETYALPCGIPDTREPRFIVTGEISTIYKRDGKTRKVHHVIVLPGLEEAEKLSHRLEAIGNLHSDGRPILGLDSRDLLEIVLESCPEAVYIPAHIWTPHFSLFGAFSGFDSIEECYGDLSPHIHALETGLSSDPPMNRRLSALDGHLLVSNSDAHSPQKLGREANLLSCGLNYADLKKALETGEGFEGTIEFFPEEGKYHLDGHRDCKCRLEPEETAMHGGLCPVCGKKITIGVLNRVEALADRSAPGVLEKPFESLIPLPELVGETLGVSFASKKAQAFYFELLQELGPEFGILREKTPDEIERAGGFLLSEAVRRLRAGQVIRQGGYDGEYGVISVFQPGEKETLLGQTSLLGVQSAPAAKKKTGSIAGKEKKTVSQTASKQKFMPNPEQEEAIRAQAETVAVIAGPGTGKTGTMVNRIAWLIEDRHVSPREITAVTFTRQAAAEMAERLEKRLGKKACRGLTVGTFHQICLSLLDKKPLVSEKTAKEILDGILRDRNETLPPDAALRMISSVKNGLTVPGIPAGLLEQYQERLNGLNLRDLDDVLTEALAVPVRGKTMFRYLLVDEYQDINPAQQALVRYWSSENQLFVIGDPDQSIYGFRGANAACFEALSSFRPHIQTIRLKQNYRSSPEIIACAGRAISKNPGGNRELQATLPEGEPVRLAIAPDEQTEYIWIAKEIARLAGGLGMTEARKGERARYAFSEIAVLCRTHRQLEQMEKCLNHDSIPCVVSGRGAYLESEKNQALLGFFAALLDPTDESSLRLALKGLWRCPEGLAQRACASLPLLRTGQLKAFADGLSAYDALSPFVDAVKEFLPKAAKESPRSLMEKLKQETGTLGRETEQMLNTAVFYDTIPDFLEAVRLGEEGDIRRLSGGVSSGAVRLMTLHAAKGLEFPAVFLAGLEEGRFPLVRPQEETDTEEERRLFFVGMTRAQHSLTLVCGGPESPFLCDLPKDLERVRVKGSLGAQVKQISFL